MYKKAGPCTCKDTYGIELQNNRSNLNKRPYRKNTKIKINFTFKKL